MRLSAWAKYKGVSYQTALMWIKRDKFPVPYEQLPSGTYIVHDPSEEKNSNDKKENGVVIYARVSTYHQKDNLERQLQRLRAYCRENGYVIQDEISEIASGLNDNRKKYNRMLGNPGIKTIIVEDRDRLARFGVKGIESALSASGRKLIIVNPTPEERDMMQDFIDVVTCMCSRIYGYRSSRNRARVALDAVKSYSDVSGEK